MLWFRKKIILFVFLSNIFLPVVASSGEIDNKFFKGYITNRNFNPIKLKINEIKNDSSYFAEQNLEDNSFVPSLNLEVTTENISDYTLTLNESNISVPASTKFIGHISEIIPPKHFNKKGFFKVTFDKVICPDGQEINLKSNIISKSETNVYNPWRHIGKSTLSLVGGSLAGTLFAYQLGGLGLAVATHGYSLAGGALAGGFLGAIAGIGSKGKEAKIEPGDDLTIIPVSEENINELKQITCKKVEPEQIKETINPGNIKIKILSIKKKKDLLGDIALKIDIEFANDSSESYRMSNFFLRDSQGKEYPTSLVDFDQDIFIDFPPKITKSARLEFLIDHPKASHWLVLKDKNFNGEVGVWKIIN